MAITALAYPSKAFFVEMLTRDISLADCILDLLDNCIDGVQRHRREEHKPASATPYTGYEAAITVSPSAFRIEDNCGGIPRAVAEKYAFRMGRPDDMPSEHLATVGRYGIGMKRSMFKMGRSAQMTTFHEGKGYVVTISPKWMRDDKDWELPIKDLLKAEVPPSLRSKGGTVVEVESLRAEVAQEFDRQASRFLVDLASTIATHYSYIIHKGFQVKLNGKTLTPRPVNLLVGHGKKDLIEPFVYRTESDGVKIDLAVGLYRNIPDEEEVNAELEGKPPSSRDTCGWTIICNDRVVLYNDRSRATGWGDASVPAYHPQFNAISGVVRFRSDDVTKLPLTTTKRGLEQGSELYLAVKDVMREGLKIFTTFTNKWKPDPDGRKALLERATATEPFHAVTGLLKKGGTDVRSGLKGRKYVPALPLPQKSGVHSSLRTIRYSKPPEEIEAVADLLFGDVTADPSVVGEACFDRLLKRATQ